MPKQRNTNLRKRGGTYYFRARLNGREYSRSLGTGDRAEARRLAQELREEYRYGRAPRRRSVSVAAFARRWIGEAVSIRRKAAGVRLAEQRLADYVLPVLGHLPADAVTVADVRGLRAELDASGLAPQTVHHVLSDVRALFRYAAKVGVVDRSPVEPEAFPRLQERAPAALSDAQVGAILEAAGPHRATVELLLEAGLRWGEALRLQWRHVLWDERELLIEEQKNGRAQYVPLTERALAALRELRAGTSSVHVVPERSTNAQAWVKGIAKRCGFHWTVHQLRHTCATRLLKQTGERELVRGMLRHSSYRMTDRYARADRDWMRDKIALAGTKAVQAREAER